MKSFENIQPQPEKEFSGNEGMEDAIERAQKRLSEKGSKLEKILRMQIHLAGVKDEDMMEWAENGDAADFRAVIENHEELIDEFESDPDSVSEKTLKMMEEKREEKNRQDDSGV